MNEFLLIAIISFCLFLVVSAVVFYFTQESVLFRPTFLEASHRYTFKGLVDFDEFALEIESSCTLSGIHFKVKNAKGLLFYFHGNSKDIQHWGNWCEDIAHRYHYDVVVYDYRGFGKSTGKRSLQRMLTDAERVYTHFEHIDLAKIIYGRSLGGAFASHVALKHNAARLVLESSFTRTAHVVLPFSAGVPPVFLLRFPFQNLDNIKKYQNQLYIIHGKRDPLVSVRHAKLLYDSSVSEHKQLHLIEGGSHWNLTEIDLYWEALEEILTN